MSGTSSAVRSFCFPPPDGVASCTIHETFKVLNWPVDKMLPSFLYHSSVGWQYGGASHGPTPNVSRQKSSLPELVSVCLKWDDSLVEILAYQWSCKEFGLVPPKIHRRFNIGFPKMHGWFRIGLPKVHRRFQMDPPKWYIWLRMVPS